MKYILPLLLTSYLIGGPSEYSDSAKEKAHRYAQFLEGMKLIEHQETLAERRHIVIAPIIIVTTEDHEDFEWTLLERGDFAELVKVKDIRE
jgi:hypothetical protein